MDTLTTNPLIFTLLSVFFLTVAVAIGAHISEDARERFVTDVLFVSGVLLAVVCALAALMPN